MHFLHICYEKILVVSFAMPPIYSKGDVAMQLTPTPILSVWNIGRLPALLFQRPLPGRNLPVRLADHFLMVGIFFSPAMKKQPFWAVS